jgi:hypothetical protein
MIIRDAPYFLAEFESDRLQRKTVRMARNRAFIDRCEKLTGKKLETYAEAIEAWDAAGYFLPWRRRQDRRGS